MLSVARTAPALNSDRTSPSVQKPYDTLTYNEKVGLNIRILRQKKGLSRKQLADAIFSNRWTVGRWENGEASVEVDWLQKVATALDSAPQDLLP